MIQVDAPVYRPGTPIRAAHLNSIVRGVKAVVKSLPANSLIDSTGIHTPRPRSHSAIRLAFCKVNAGIGNTIVCFLDKDLTGVEVTVTCDIIGTFDLNNCVPRLIIGHPLKIALISGIWHSTGDFQLSGDCD